jgi:hypothetical protein
VIGSVSPSLLGPDAGLTDGLSDAGHRENDGS